MTHTQELLNLFYRLLPPRPSSSFLSVVVFWLSLFTDSFLQSWGLKQGLAQVTDMCYYMPIPLFLKSTLNFVF